ncbi:MAG: response regulator [Candidatus Scalindua sp.]|nr:response regulator [Candidatus Scalindua sp.]
MNIECLCVLIVDSNKDNHPLLRKSLTDAIKNIDIHLSDTVEDGLRKLSQKRYNILLVGSGLFDMGVIDFLHKVEKADHHLPIIMIMNAEDKNIVEEAMELGVRGFLNKSEGYLERLPLMMLKISKEYLVRNEVEMIERKLEESELRYRMLVEDIVDVVFSADKELNILSINLACQRVFECSKEKALGLNLYELVIEEDREKIIDCLKGAFASKREFIEGLEFRIRTRSGNIKYVELNAKVFYSEQDGKVLTEGVIRDITERKKIEQKLFQIDKLNALGLQSSGIAHEFNNVLGIILGYLDILKLRLDGSNDQVMDTINIIDKAARDGAIIVDKIQQFSKTKLSYSGAEQTDLVKIVHEAVEFTMPRWKREAETKGIEYIIKNNLNNLRLNVRSNPTELREVIVNIINNSVDAMPDGGTIEFSATTDVESVVLSISDDGMGIEEEIKDKIFDPFFTTKGVKRSGLGMSVSYSIITRYGGVIRIDSRYGKGTTVHIKMPLYSQEIMKRVKDQEAISDQKAKILIIEDEEVILEMMKIILEGKGHKVFISKDASVGLEMYENDQYDVVLCDLAMPKVNGWKVANFIKNLDAIRKATKTPVILITGYELDTESIDYKKEGVDFILQKPIEFEKLERIISNLIAV